jgi:hypothetical protein
MRTLLALCTGPSGSFELRRFLGNGPGVDRIFRDRPRAARR